MGWPTSSPARDAFVVQRREPIASHDPWAAPAILIEQEPTPEGGPAETLTVFLVGRECPWRCVMCDLWKQTTAGDTPIGAIPAQIRSAWSGCQARGVAATRIKLYNAGSFFDPRAVPEDDYQPIAALLKPFTRVVVECHPALVGTRVDRFLELLAIEAPRATLEVAMGLETAHPAALESLNKRMDVPRFTQAAGYLRQRGVAMRVFVLVSPPFVPDEEQDQWLLASLDVAIECGASVISLIPTRGGNGAMEALADEGLFRPPSATTVSRSVALARRHVGRRALLLLDPWSAS